MSVSDRAKRLADSLIRAREASSHLEQETEGVNGVITRAESMLANLRMGVAASVKLWDDGNGHFTYIGFGKVDKVWRLTIETGWEGDDEIDVSPLANASRQIRLEALDLLPDLVNELIKESEREVVNVAKKRASAEQFLDDLGHALTLSAADEAPEPIKTSESDVVNPLPRRQLLTKSTPNERSPYAPQKKPLTGTGAAIAAGIARGVTITEVPTKKPSGGK
jgi:hypothetical protein